MTTAPAGSVPSGLASMLADLIDQNLARDPRRRSFLRSAVVVLEVVDAGVTATLRIDPDGVIVTDGGVPDAHLRITTDAERLLSLTTVPLWLGLPHPMRGEGRSVLRDLLTRRLVVRGLLRHPVRLARLTALLSVVGDP